MNEAEIKALVERFLAWPVPASCYPDGIPGQPGRTGTNLLSYGEAKEMLEHVLAAPAAPLIIRPRDDEAYYREACSAATGPGTARVNTKVSDDLVAELTPYHPSGLSERDADTMRSRGQARWDRLLAIAAATPHHPV